MCIEKPVKKISVYNFLLPIMKYVKNITLQHFIIQKSKG